MEDIKSQSPETYEKIFSSMKEDYKSSKKRISPRRRLFISQQNKRFPSPPPMKKYSASQKSDSMEPTEEI
jgi:hypothetical protein